MRSTSTFSLWLVVFTAFLINVSQARSIHERRSMSSIGNHDIDAAVGLKEISQRQTRKVRRNKRDDSNTQASGSGSISGSTSGGSLVVNNSFGSSATADGTTSNYANNAGIARGPNTSFGASAGTSSGALNDQSNSFSGGNAAISGSTGSNYGYGSGGIQISIP